MGFEKGGVGVLVSFYIFPHIPFFFPYKKKKPVLSPTINKKIKN